MPQQSETLTPFYARLKPFDPKRDHAMKVYVFGMRRFDAGVWTPVAEALAKNLRGVRQSYNDELSPLAFEILSYAEAKEHGIVPAEEGAPQPETPTASASEASANEAGGENVEATARSPRGKKGREG